MKQHTARVIAYIASSLETGKSSGRVYDYSVSAATSMSGTVTMSQVNVYDCGQSCHVGGNGRNGDFSLYHYGNSAYVSFKRDGKGRFSGYDYDTSSHFSGTVNGGSVSLYDYQNSAYTNYSV